MSSTATVGTPASRAARMYAPAPDAAKSEAAAKKASAPAE